MYCEKVKEKQKGVPRKVTRPEEQLCIFLGPGILAKSRGGALWPKAIHGLRRVGSRVLGCPPQGPSVPVQWSGAAPSQCFWAVLCRGGPSSRANCVELQSSFLRELLTARLHLPVPCGRKVVAKYF